MCVVAVVSGYSQSFEKRTLVLQTIAQKESPPYFAVVAARLKTNTNPELALKQLDTLLQIERGDMFWMYGCAGLYFSCRNELPSAFKYRIQNAWKVCTPYRGDTENHFLMYYASLYLFSQEWPLLDEHQWFLGKSSSEIHKESREYLHHWINEVSTVGMMEFDSPRYMYYFITPLVLLGEYAANEEDKRLFTMALELLLADYAHDYYFGNYAGAHSRVSLESPFDTRNTESSSYGDLYFEENITHFLPDIAFAAISSFSCPEIIKNIATKKVFPFESIEAKRGRTTLRYANLIHSPVIKKLFATKEYALGSMQGGLISPIQQQSWTLTINSNKPKNIITGLHPFIEKEELGMFFPEEPSWQLERIENAKRGYSNEDKWVGGSPFDSLKQDKNVLIATYQNIRKKIRSQKVAVAIPRWGRITTSVDSTSIHVQCDSFSFELAMPQKFKRTTDQYSYRFESDVTGGAAGYTITCPPPSTPYSPLTISGEYLYLSENIRSVLGSGVIELHFGEQKRIYDFTRNVVTE